MDLWVLDEDLSVISLLDTFESLIWTDRYCGAGDFEIFTPVTTDLLDKLTLNGYLSSNDSEYAMIIETIEIRADEEKGNMLLVNGRSLESILDRRIVWQQTILSGNLQNGILRLINENIISPTDSDRKIDNFIFEVSTDPNITSLIVDTQFTGTNLYEAIQKLCMINNIGFKITLNDENQFVFRLYSGEDRSYEQFKNPYVIFSSNFDNINNSNYLESDRDLRTITLVAGEGEGLERKTTTVGSGKALDRREMFTDARDVSQTSDDKELTDSEYRALLEQRGAEKLGEFIFKKAFDGEADTSSMYTYGRDFFMGDIVQMENEYGMAANARVTELIRTKSLQGVEVYPTLTMVDVTEFPSSGVLTPGGGVPKSMPANGGNADTVGGKAVNELITIQRNSFSVEGRSDTFYPVILKGVTGSTYFGSQIIHLYRSYSARAPNDWNTPTHKGGLNLKIETYLAGWGGMIYYMDMLVSQTYSQVLADVQVIGPDTNTICVWLRGGGADYNFETTAPNVQVQVVLGTYVHMPGTSYTLSFPSRTTHESVFARTSYRRKIYAGVEIYKTNNYRMPSQATSQF